MRPTYTYPSQRYRPRTSSHEVPVAYAAPPANTAYAGGYQREAAPYRAQQALPYQAQQAPPYRVQQAPPYQAQQAPDPYWAPPRPAPAGAPYGTAPTAAGYYAQTPRAPQVNNAECPRPEDADRVPDSPENDEKKVDNATIMIGLAVVCGCFLVVLCAILMFASTPKRKDTVGETVYQSWAVVSDAKECANVARDIFDKNGGLGDAAVAVLLCMGVTAPHLAGLGGGFVAVVYDNSKRQVRALDSLGISPAGTTAGMFGSEHRSSKHGARATIIPGALAGYRELHKSFGKFEWKELFAPAIQLARNGFNIGNHLAQALSDGAKDIEAASALKSRFSRQQTKSLLQSGERLVQSGLADILEKISLQGTDYFYKGELAKEIASAVGGAGGLMNTTDLANYKPSWVDAIGVKTQSGKYLYSAPIPGCGVILAAAIHKVALKRIFHDELDSSGIPRMSKEKIHSFIERLKLALAQRPELGDQKEALQKQEGILDAIIGEDSKLNGTVPMAQASDYGLRHAPEEDYGGAHLSILAPNGDALSVTSSLNGPFGSMFVTPSGLLLNNYMDAFSKPGRRFDLDASPANLLGPWKRPMTSMVPSIITEGKAPSNVFGIFGAGGGLEGLSALAQLITCLGAYPLWRCVRDDVRMQPTFRETVSGLVYVDGKSSVFDPEALLRKIGHKVVLRSLKSTASGIISIGNLSWFATSDSVHGDGSKAGR